MPVRNIVTITTPGLRGNGVRDARERTDFNRQDLVIRKKKERNRRLVEIVMYLLGFTI